MNCAAPCLLFEPLAAAELFPLEDATVWLDPSTARVALLNPLAGYVWACRKAGIAPDEIADDLASETGAPRDELHSAVCAALTGFATGGLLDAPSAIPDFAPRRVSPPLQPALTTRHAVLGKTIELRYADARLAEFVEPALAPLSCAGDESAVRTLDVFEDEGDFVVAGAGLEPVSHVIPARLKSLAAGQLVQAALPGDDLFAILHAGAVADGRRSVLLPGESGAGKSTLTAALVAAGLDYLSDDFVPIHSRSCRALPFPLAMSVKEGSWPAVLRMFPELMEQPEYQHDGQRVRYLPIPSSAPVAGYPIAALVFPRRVADAALRAESLPASGALERLLKANSWLRSPVAPEAFARFLELLERIPAWELEYSNVSEAAAWVRTCFP